MYLGLSALDFPFCFLAVRALGADKIGEYEEIIVDKFWSVMRTVVPGIRERAEQDEVKDEEPSEVEEMTEEMERRKKERGSKTGKCQLSKK